VRAVVTALALTLGVAGATSLRVLDTRAGLEESKLVGVTLEAGSALRATLNPNTKWGTLETPPISAPAFDTAIVSWNAITPTGTFVKLEVRARIGKRWTGYYPLALWSSDLRMGAHSYAMAESSNSDGGISTDTLKLKRAANALQVRVRLETKTPGSRPSLTALATVTSDSKRHFTPDPTPSDRSAWGRELPVPAHSQMLYPDGGEVWCSPTSVTMILGYYGPTLVDTVPQAAKATWDSVYDGSGNWPFNTAYAASKGLRAYVSRLGSLAQAEAFIGRGVPLALSIAWSAGELDGAHITKSGGHLVVLRGFTKTGDPIINDPAASADAGVRTIYKRAQFERAWVGHSGGVVYVIEKP
jgi:Peptidase_C39 like family